MGFAGNDSKSVITVHIMCLMYKKNSQEIKLSLSLLIGSLQSHLLIDFSEIFGYFESTKELKKRKKIKTNMCCISVYIQDHVEGSHDTISANHRQDCK